MPIGVPRIIYCWGEELPAQWTDIYNFIFRRRMVFLMQYLDDELCNQICGLLINIHMEDRSKELEKKEMEKSGLFKSTTSKSSKNIKKETSSGNTITKKPSVEDLLTSDRDFGIDDNHLLEQYTLQKITTEWLNWNAQFFDYSDEPYLYYLAEILNKDFSKSSDTKNLKYGENSRAQSNISPGPNTAEMTNLIKQLKNISSIRAQSNISSYNGSSSPFDTSGNILSQPESFNSGRSKTNAGWQPERSSGLDVYSPFRLLANFAPQNYNLEQLNLSNVSSSPGNPTSFAEILCVLKNSSINNTQNLSKKLIENISHNNFSEKVQTPENLFLSSEKALSQRRLKQRYVQDRLASKTFRSNETFGRSNSALQAYNYLDYNSLNTESGRTLYRKQTERVIQEEESKKVFMIINSFGGSVGNGITVHDALQFIKAGSLTLALGVAASAASLALAGGTIGERYVTEGCHTMIHQPESGLNGQASDIWIDSQEIMKIRLDVAEIYSLSTYRPRHKILRDLDRDFYLTAMETIYYGLADEIATNEVLHDIISMTSKVWDYHDSKQQRLLETRDSQTAGFDTQTQN